MLTENTRSEVFRSGTCRTAVGQPHRVHSVLHTAAKADLWRPEPHGRRVLDYGQLRGAVRSSSFGSACEKETINDYLPAM
jgi:hypothetical protein